MMHIHEQVLDAANRIASQRRDYTFSVDEIVRALPHLNQSSVRTHVGSRCCVNAPKNHLHRWDYFRRVARGKYQVLPKYRRTGSAAQSSPPIPSGRAAIPSKAKPSHRHAIHVVIHEDEGVYVAECLELAVVTQGGTLDEVIENLKQAVILHLEDEDVVALGLTARPRLQIVYDASLAL